MPTKDQAKDEATTTTTTTTAPPADDRPESFAVERAVAEEAAFREAISESVETGKHGPVLRVPKTQEEHTKVANAQQATVNKLLGLDRERPAADPDAPRPRKRVFAMDGPYNLNERQGFDPMRPDMTTDAAATVPAPVPAGKGSRR